MWIESEDKNLHDINTFSKIECKKEEFKINQNDSEFYIYATYHKIQGERFGVVLKQFHTQKDMDNYMDIIKKYIYEGRNLLHEEKEEPEAFNEFLRDKFERIDNDKNT